MGILLAILLFGLLILVHEFGHFLLAKKNGVCVTEFSLGMGPRIFSFVKGETRYSWKLVPFGGSCMMLGEDEELEEGQDADRAFDSKSVWARISVILAGPIFNFILAFVIALIVIGFNGSDPAFVTVVEEGSPAASAGLLEGDVITKYNGVGVSLGREIYIENQLNPIKGEPVEVVVKRDGEKIKLTIQPELVKSFYLGIGYTGDKSAGTDITVVEDGPMDKTGVKDKDQVISINDVKVNNGEEIKNYFDENPLTEEPVKVTLSRDGKEYNVTVTPAEKEGYYIGLGYNTRNQKMSGLGTIKYSAIEVKTQIKLVFKSLKMLVSGQAGADDLAGPVGIVDMVSSTVNESKSEGWFVVFLQLASFTIMFSANLGVMNLLPLPALDGGRLVFLLIEAVRGKPVAKNKEGMVHFVGMIFLMLLMLFIFYNDIMRLFGR